MHLYLQPNLARMAELVDASDSKSGIRKDVQVRFLFRAQKHFFTESAFVFKLNVDNGFNELVYWSQNDS